MMNTSLFTKNPNLQPSRIDGIWIGFITIIDHSISYFNIESIEWVEFGF